MGWGVQQGAEGAKERGARTLVIRAVSAEAVGTGYGRAAARRAAGRGYQGLRSAALAHPTPAQAQAFVSTRARTSLICPYF